MRANGFTLVEILAALVAGSLLLTALAWTMTTMLREFGGLRESDASRLGAVSPAIISMIEQAAAATPLADPTMAQADSLEIRTAPPRALGSPGDVRAILRVGRTAAGATLSARFAPSSPGQRLPAAAAEETVIASGYEDIAFSYARSSAPDGTALLEKVAIDFTSPGGKVERIVAAPRINSSGTCRFDPISLSCRP